MPSIPRWNDECRSESTGRADRSLTGRAPRDPFSAAAVRAALAPVTNATRTATRSPSRRGRAHRGHRHPLGFDLSAAPSREWRAAFLRPPPALTTSYHIQTVAAFPFRGPRCTSAPHLGTGVTGCVGLTAGLATPTASLKSDLARAPPYVGSNWWRSRSHAAKHGRWT